MFCTIKNPTIIRIGLIAVAGMMEIHGIKTTVAKNKIPAVIAALPVFPPDAITAAFSALEIVGDVPNIPERN